MVDEYRRAILVQSRYTNAMQGMRHVVGARVDARIQKMLRAAKGS